MTSTTRHHTLDHSRDGMAAGQTVYCVCGLARESGMGWPNTPCPGANAPAGKALVQKMAQTNHEAIGKAFSEGREISGDAARAIGMRAALRSVRDEDISDEVCDAAADVFWGARAADDTKQIYRPNFRRAIATAIAKASE